MINRVVLVGRMAADPELRYTPSGVAMSKFRVAVNRPFQSAQGEREADFIDVVAWRQSAQFAADYLRKGRLVGIEGRIQVRSYTNQEGQRRRFTEVVADRVQALERRREEDPAGPSQPSSQSDSDDNQSQYQDDFSGGDPASDVFQDQ